MSLRVMQNKDNQTRNRINSISDACLRVMQNKDNQTR